MKEEESKTTNMTIRAIVMKATAVAMLLIVITVMLCSCNGGGISGTWYNIKDASEASYENFEFKSGNVCENEGISGKYEVSGDTVTVQFVGIMEDYTIGEYEGCKVMFKDGSKKPFLARSLEDAKRLNEMLYSE